MINKNFNFYFYLLHLWFLWLLYDTPLFVCRSGNWNGAAGRGGGVQMQNKLVRHENSVTLGTHGEQGRQSDEPIKTFLKSHLLTRDTRHARYVKWARLYAQIVEIRGFRSGNTSIRGGGVLCKFVRVTFTIIRCFYWFARKRARHYVK